MNKTVIQIQNLSKSFPVGNQKVPVLKNLNFGIESGDFCIIVGPSGCGKSTLLHTILGLEKPTWGTCHLLSQDLYHDMDEDQISEFRKNHIGMIYQQPNWIKSLTVLENVAFPLVLMGKPHSENLINANNLLTAIKMDPWASYLPTQLSSGQQQKVSLVRALISNPEIIIADEPTGNLDFESGQELMQLLVDLNHQKGKTILMVTHDLEYLKFAKTILKMFDGNIVSKYKQKQHDR
ncbi:MAG: ABC transporter ATP-binding protein [Candidatus Shapirobacteria bacterium]|jgi:putative ABC transport system ATP-binding protein